MPTRKPRSAKRSAVPLRARRKRALNHQSTATSKLERRRGSPETLRLRALEPSFTVNDLERRLRFYVDVLGFIVGKRWTDGGVRRGVTLKASVCELGLLQGRLGKGRDRQKGEAVRIRCSTAQDIDALAVRIRRGEGRLTEGP